MIKWKEYSSETGEQIEFCCDNLKSIYANLLTWDPADKKWCIKVDRITMIQNPNNSQLIVKKVDGLQDLKHIDYCMFCGKNIYKDEMRYDTTGPGWGTYVCGSVPKLTPN